MTELTDKMRTCAAYLCGEAKAGDGSLRDFGRAIIDAAALLNEAADLLEATPAPLGEPVKIIEPIKSGADWMEPLAYPPGSPPGTWVGAGDTLPTANPYRSPRTCPHCDSRATKTVRRIGGRMMLECPACGLQWEWQ